MVALRFLLLFCIVKSQNIFRHHYELYFERADISNLNLKLANATAYISMYNRTARPLNMKFKIFTDLQEDATVFITGFQWKSNEYRLTALQFPIKLRNAINWEIGGFDTIAKICVPPLLWPLKKRVTYSLENWFPNNQKMPFPYSPVGKWKDIISFYLDNKITKAFDLNVYYRIEDIPDFQ